MILNKNFLNVRSNAIIIFPSIVTSGRHIGMPITDCDEIFLIIYLILGMCFRNHMIDVIKEDLASILMDCSLLNGILLRRQDRHLNDPGLLHFLFLLKGIFRHDAALM